MLHFYILLNLFACDAFDTFCLLFPSDNGCLELVIVIPTRLFCWFCRCQCCASSWVAGWLSFTFSVSKAICLIHCIHCRYQCNYEATTVEPADEPAATIRNCSPLTPMHHTQGIVVEPRCTPTWGPQSKATGRSKSERSPVFLGWAWLQRHTDLQDWNSPWLKIWGYTQIPFKTHAWKCWDVAGA